MRSQVTRTIQPRRRSASPLALEALEGRELLDAGLGRLAALAGNPADQIEGFYAAFLGRAADANGAAYWHNQFAAGADAGQAALGFLTSTEYVERHNADGWLSGVYSDLLGRQPDAAGVAFWDEHLAAGTPRRDVAQGILGSSEARERTTPDVAPTLAVQLRDVPDAAADLGTLATSFGATVEDTGTPGLARVRGGALDGLLGALRTQPFVATVDFDGVVHVDLTPNDSSFSSLWGLGGGNGIKATTAWDSFTGATNVTVAVIDTGVDYNHPDLYLNIWLNQGEIPPAIRANLTDTDGDGLITFWDLNVPINRGAGKANDVNGDGRISGSDVLASTAQGGFADGVSNDGDAYKDDLLGWNFVANSNNPMDDNNHGTHCAGTVGGIGNNVAGVAGVNWRTQIMALKFLGANGSGATSAAGSSLRYAVDHGARVSSNSYGGGSDTNLFNAISYANTRNHLFVAAAGNSSANADTSPSYPAAYTLANIVSVAATDINGNRASFSNYGAVSVDLGAPGVGIVSTVRNGGYASFNGTSMATPHVAGAATLVLAANPTLSVAQLKDRLLSTTTPLASLAGRTVTGGLLNVAGALRGNSERTLPDFNGDGVGDLLVAHATNTSSGMTEVDVVDGASGFQTVLLHAVTPWAGFADGSAAFDFADANNDGKTDLYIFQRWGGATGTFEVHVLDGASGFQNYLLRTGTALGAVDAAFDFQVADFNRDGRLDVATFKKSATGSLSTEVHVLDGATNFQTWLLHTGTGLHEVGGEAWLRLADVNRDGFLDLVYVKKYNTGSDKTEVHVLSGANTFQTWLVHAATGLHPTGDEADFRCADINADGALDLVYVKKFNTGSGHTELHALAGGSYLSFALHTATPLPEMT